MSRLDDWQDSTLTETVNSRALAELQKKSLRDLHNSLSDFSPGHEWFIYVKWSEPDEQMNWSRYDAYGPFSERFFRWLDQHWDYWQDKAAASINLEEVHYVQKSGLERTW